MAALVDVAQPIEQIFKAQIQGAQVEPQNGAAGVINDLDLLEDQTIFLVTQVAAAKDPVGWVDEPADEAVEVEPRPELALHALLLPAPILFP